MFFRASCNLVSQIVKQAKKNIKDLIKSLPARLKRYSVG